MSEAQLNAASKGFDLLFSDDIKQARLILSQDPESPYHQTGLGVCSFLEAALGLETDQMAEAARCLTLAEAGSRKLLKSATSKPSSHRFPAGIDMEILNADAVVLLGITHALSESYVGYLQCMYSLNSAHSKFTKLYKTVFPNGLEGYSTPSASPSVSRKSSNPSLKSTTALVPKSGFFSRWTSSASSSTLNVPDFTPDNIVEGSIEETIVSGTAFGYGLFNLVFSLLPRRVQGVVGLLGFKHDRKLALQALAVSAAKKDVHSVFAGLCLMSYYGVLLLLCGYLADEAHIIKQYTAIVESLESRYPTGSLWILNRAKIQRMSGDPVGAIEHLQQGLKNESKMFAQADTLLIFELAWLLLAERRYEESAKMFMRMTELNSWSHATYYFIAAGCYISLGNVAKAQELLDQIPNLVDKRKVGGKELPTEVLIKKKLIFYKENQRRRGGDEKLWAQSIRISPSDELGIFWNTHSRISKENAEAHIAIWSAFTPLPDESGKSTVPDSVLSDLDTPDELALRALLLGIAYRSARNWKLSRSFLEQAHAAQPTIKVSTWIGSVALFELAVLILKETEAMETKTQEELVTGVSESPLYNTWTESLTAASENLDQAMTLSTSSTDLSSRLDSRIAMLKGEIATKREVLGIVI
ncbi:outer membrane protein Iml2/Tetratricopeptide repeat protein 39 [Mycena floridula]|nr:outer membrane protein Iml2/Tetratricopeptide repeat protein 39 [Mycena floridula]